MRPDETINVLLVEDDSGDARLIQNALQAAHKTRFELVHRKTLADAMDHLANTAPDVIVLDLGLPDATGVEVIRRTRVSAPSVPVVVLTGRDEDTIGVQALHEGAQDYLTKRDLDSRLLSRALRYAMERQRMQMVLRNESLLDALTGLYNRRGFMSLAGNHLKLAERTRSAFALVFLDLDGMKSINDLHGHAEGDRALIDTATLLKAFTRQSDILGRLGGDEFAMLLAAVDRDAEASIRRRLEDHVKAVNLQPGRKYGLSLSMGIVVCDPLAPQTLEALLARADSLMYEEKRSRQPGAGSRY